MHDEYDNEGIEADIEAAQREYDDIAATACPADGACSAELFESMSIENFGTLFANTIGQRVEEHYRLKVERAKLSALCRMIGAKIDVSEYDDGGSITVEFPDGWTVDLAERYASRILDIDLQSYSGGPGSYFAQSNSGTDETGTVFVSRRWGYDV